MIAEGARVQYVGDGDGGLSIGDRGKVLSNAGSGSHVMWQSGQRRGDITLVANMDLVATNGAQITYDDSLETGQIVTFAVRDVYDHRGDVGLVNALNDEGHFATLGSIAEEALALVTARLREDASMREVLAQLDEDEGAEFISFTATVLLRDAFRGAL